MSRPAVTILALLMSASCRRGSGVKRLILLAIIAAACTGTARADYSAQDLAGYCSVLHVKGSNDYNVGLSQGVCVGYIAAFIASHEQYKVDVVHTADEFAAFGKRFGPDFPAETALYVMLEKDRNAKNL